VLTIKEFREGHRIKMMKKLMKLLVKEIQNPERLEEEEENTVNHGHVTI